MTLDVDKRLTELTLAEKASLTSGSAFWFTAAVERLGIPPDHGVGRATRRAGPAGCGGPPRPGGILPLDTEARIAVIGEFARTPRFQGRRQLPGQPHPGRKRLRRAAIPGSDLYLYRHSNYVR
jgi:hypothetical protein